MNSWNQSTSYANNVKVYNLDIPTELKDKAWDFVCSENTLWELADDINFCIEKFKRDTGYDAGFNGRCDGYVVMYDTEWDWKQNKSITYPGRDIDMYEDFEDWDIKDIRERVKLVQRFDQMCDDMLQTFIYYLENYELVDEEYTVIKTRKVLQEIS
jgi:hypothetical protein